VKGGGKMDSLIKIQPYIQDIAELINLTLQIDTEIIDITEGIVVGGTGKIREQVLTKQNDMHINYYVSHLMKPFILNEPGTHKICTNCTEKKNCIYTGGIFYPITYQNHCYGVISLISFNKADKTSLFEKQKIHLNFISKIAELLAVKTAAFNSFDGYLLLDKQFDVIMNMVNYGVMCCDNNGIITKINQIVEERIGVPSSFVIGRQIETVITEALSSEAITNSLSFSKEQSKQIINNNEIALYNENKLLGFVKIFNREHIISDITHQTDAEGYSAMDKIIGKSEIINDIKSQLIVAAKSSSTVLITGESGTGKDLFAHIIHNISNRASHPFSIINCSAIPESLLESELYGYEKGAFTGAKNEGKTGKIQMADGGTILLDEIGDMPFSLQAKILRFIEEKAIEKIGGEKFINIDVRIIAATNHNIPDLINKKMFRQDLFYRLNVIPINIPPLRDRVADIPLLTDSFAKQYSKIMNKNIKSISYSVYEALQLYNWPGNVRELKNVIEYAVNFCKTNIIDLDTLPKWLLDEVKNNNAIKPNLNEIDDIKLYLIDALTKKGNTVKSKREIATDLGISLSTMYRLLNQYNFYLQ
jgi:sigma-54 dependent transcriptional regulator, acetoin dehydrogenase operon transcriptional activator AcoR